MPAGPGFGVTDAPNGPTLRTTMDDAARGIVVWIGALLVGVGCAFAQGAPPTPVPVRLEKVRSFGLDGGSVTAAAFAPDGGAIATAGELGDLVMIDLPARSERWRTPPGDHSVRELSFSPDGKRLACLGDRLTVLDTSNGTEIWRLEVPRQLCGLHAAAWCADGARIVFVSECEVRVFDGRASVRVAAFDRPVSSLCFGEKDELLVGDELGRLWRLGLSGGPPELLLDRGKQAPFEHLVWAGGQRIDVENGRVHRGSETFEVPGKVHALAVAPDGRSFALGGAGKLARWWTEGGAKVTDLAMPAPVGEIALAPDGKALFVAMMGAAEALYRVGEPPIALPSHPSPIRSVKLSRDGATIAAEGGGFSLLPIQGGPARPLPAARRIAVGGRADEWLVQEEKRVVVLEGTTGREIASFAWEHDRDCLAAGPGQRILIGEGRLVDPRSGSSMVLRKDLRFRGGMETARASTGAWALGTASGYHHPDSGSLYITDAEGGVRFTNYDGPVFSVSFSRDGRKLYIICNYFLSSDDNERGGLLRVRDAETGAVLGESPQRFLCLKVLDDHRALAITESGWLQVWDLESLQGLQTLDVGWPCLGFELSDDGKTLVLWNRREVTVYRVVIGQ